jgi:UDP-N-acetyl-D-galactosamine dehydrogenase
MEKIVIIGLGYVGLPLAYEFSKKHCVLGFDINQSRVNEINEGIDKTLEINSKSLSSVLRQKNQNKNGLHCSNQIETIINFQSKFFIITVPTPVDKNKKPDLSPLLNATKLVGSIITKGCYVIYESTVYPGVTENECSPILEQKSKLELNKDFFLGYSPERINPGDKERSLTKILKITSGSTNQSSLIINNLYKSIISAGTYMAPSIKVAEATKVIENSQRDINIAFVNELAKIFSILNIDTNEVLKAAGTKWNFLNFKPGLVGGHCIGVDPYYLADIALKNGYSPDIILSGRRLNDSMGKFVSGEVIKLMVSKNIKVKNSSILILGITFKENCPDYRNTRVVDVIEELQKCGAKVSIYDPWANPSEISSEYGLKSMKSCPKLTFDAIVLAVSHKEFLNLDLNLLKKKSSVVYDVKGFLGDMSDKKL